MTDAQQAEHGHPERGGWLRVGPAVILVAAGIHLLTRPLTTAAVIVLLVAAGFVVTGVWDLVEARTSERRGIDSAVAVLWLGVGVVLGARPQITLGLLVILIGVGLVVRGLARIVAAFGGGIDQRVSSGIAGLATTLFGLLALALPDVSFFLITVGFGGWLVFHGLSRLWGAMTAGRTIETIPVPEGVGLVRRWTRVIGAVSALVVAVGAVSVALVIRETVPVVDGFYTPPASVAAQPGVLLRTEPFTREVPDGALAWRILYTTTRDDDQPAVASAIVVTPTNPNDRTGAAIVWAHGTTGIARHCAPSLQAQPFESGALFVLDEIIEQGWTLVATDYIGLGTEGPHPYLIGQGSGRATLDAVRAARQMDTVDLNGGTVVWGHSQGGGAALWAGVLAPSYAPDVDVLGVAALAPASDLAGFAAVLDDVPGGLIFASYVLAAYSRNYPDVAWDDYVHPGASTILRQASTRCLADPGLLLSVVESLAISGDVPWYTVSPNDGPFGRRLAENTPPPGIIAPVLIGQGLDDSLITPSLQAAYLTGLCEAGRPIDYRAYEGRDHVGLVTADSPLIADLLAWTEDRLNRMVFEPAPFCDAARGRGDGEN